MVISGNFTLAPDPSIWKNLPNDTVRLFCDTTGGPVNITLPAIADLLGIWNVKIFVVDISDNAATNNITVNVGSATDKIDTGASIVLNINGSSTEIQVVSESKWMSLESNLPVVLPSWLLGGNVVGVLKYIGTLDNFDFPVIVNNVEVARFSTDKRLFINDTKTNNGSNAGLQYSSTVANRAQIRNNQYGANNAGPGLTTFKSRGLIIGAPLAAGDGVQVGDIIQGFTAIAVTGSGLLIPLAYTQRVTVVDVTAGNVACDWDISLCPIGGATNSIRKVFGVTSEGILKILEAANSMGGLAVLDAAGTITVANTNVKANTRFQITVQDGGAAPTGIIYQSARIVGTSFTILSSAGAGDAGVQVYYQLFEPEA